MSRRDSSAAVIIHEKTSVPVRRVRLLGRIKMRKPVTLGLAESWLVLSAASIRLTGLAIRLVLQGMALKREMYSFNEP